MAKFDDAYYVNILTLLGETLEGEVNTATVIRPQEQVLVSGKFVYNGEEYSMVLGFAWKHDGTEGKPKTWLRIGECTHSYGRFSLWPDFREVVEDMISSANTLLDEVLETQ